MNGTSCKNCTAAVYEKTGKTQIQCAFGRLRVLDANGVKITPAYDEEKEFFVLDKICYYYRTQEWSDDHIGEVMLDLVEKENSLIYNAILWENSEINLSQAITNLSSQHNKPKHITVLLRYNTAWSSLYLKEQLEVSGIPWTLAEKTGIETDDIYHGVKEAIIRRSAPFFLMVFSHEDIITNLFTNIEKDMTDKGLSFHYVLCPKKSILLPRKILKYYITMERGNFINKILEDECLTPYNT